MKYKKAVLVLTVTSILVSSVAVLLSAIYSNNIPLYVAGGMTTSFYALFLCMDKK